MTAVGVLTVMLAIVALALLGYACSVSYALFRFSAVLKEHRKELDELQKFRAYSLLLMQMDRDREEVNRTLKQFGMDPLGETP